MKRVAWNHVGHCYQKHGQTQDQADPESAHHVCFFVAWTILQFDSARFQSHSAFGTWAGVIAHHFGMHRTDVFDLRKRGLIDRFQAHSTMRADTGADLPHVWMHGAGKLGP